MRSIQSKDGHWPHHRRLAYLLAPALLIGAFALGGSAQAAVQAPAAPSAKALAAACDFTSGTTSNLRTTANGPAPTGGTVFTFPSGTTCLDLNLSFVSATDSYEGWLENVSTGVWSHCARGFVHITAGQKSTTNPPVLCTDVLPGTPMAVVQESATQRTVTVED
jgi:hypothetical protein